MLFVQTLAQRQANLAKARAARSLRAQMLGRIRLGEMTLTEVFSQVSEDTAGVAAKTRLGQLLKSIPNVGPVRIQQLVSELGVDERLRIGRLGLRQRQGVIDMVETWQKPPATS